MQKVKIGVSSCLLGEEVRFDGGHKRDRFVTDILSDCFDYVSICPEMAIGLGVPRPTIRLVGDEQNWRIKGVKDQNIDVTDDLHQYGAKMAEKNQDISGYIFKSKSPSCGVFRMKIYNEKGVTQSHKGVGAYAQSFMAKQPLLPVEEEGRLNDVGLRDNFFARVYTYYRWQNMVSNPSFKMSDLVKFHSQHKYLIMAHNKAAYKRLGCLVANSDGLNFNELSGSYIEDLMKSLKRIAGRKAHVNVIQHIFGYLKRDLDADDKAEFLDILDRYYHGHLSLIVPVMMLRHYFRKYPNDYINEQVYLSPYPDDLFQRSGL